MKSRHVLVLLWILLSVIALAACEPGRPVNLAADACYEPVGDTESLIDLEQGVCFLYPEPYETAEPVEDEIVVFVESIMNVSMPRLYLNREALGAASLDEAADAVEAEAVAIMGEDGVRRAEITVGGEPAIRLEPLPGQDLGRLVLVVRGDSLYRLLFVPADPLEPESYGEMEALYGTVIETLVFLPPE